MVIVVVTGSKVTNRPRERVNHTTRKNPTCSQPITYAQSELQAGAGGPENAGCAAWNIRFSKVSRTRCNRQNRPHTRCNLQNRPRKPDCAAQPDHGTVLTPAETAQSITMPPIRRRPACLVNSVVLGDGQSVLERVDQGARKAPNLFRENVDLKQAPRDANDVANLSTDEFMKLYKDHPRATWASGGGESDTHFRTLH